MASVRIISSGIYTFKACVKHFCCFVTYQSSVPVCVDASAHCKVVSAKSTAAAGCELSSAAGLGRTPASSSSRGCSDT